MDQMKTGRLIALMRKEKGYTQRQLAEILGISDKTLSKWETGRGFPEMSLIMPLCEALGIRADDLLTGNIPAEIPEISEPENFRRPAKPLWKTCLFAAGTVAAIETAVAVLCWFIERDAVEPLAYNILVWVSLGAASGIKWGWDVRRLRRMKRRGLALAGTITDIIPNGWVRMGNYATSRVLCTYSCGGAEYRAKSGYYLLSPFTRYEAVKATVYCDPEDPKTYAVEIMV